jgi:hypothetical protein
MGTATTPIIDYAPRRASFVRRHAKRLILLTALLSIAVAAYLVREPVGRWVMWQYWFRKVVAVEVVNSNSATTLPATRPTREHLHALDRWFERDVRTEDVLAPSSIDRLLFAGLMSRPDGEPRWVMIFCNEEINVGALDHEIQALVLRPPSVFSGVPQTPSMREVQSGDTRDSGWMLYEPGVAFTASRYGSALLIPIEAARPASPGSQASKSPGRSAVRGVISVTLANDNRLKCTVMHRDPASVVFQAQSGLPDFVPTIVRDP